MPTHRQRINAMKAHGLLAVLSLFILSGCQEYAAKKTAEQAIPVKHTLERRPYPLDTTIALSLSESWLPTKNVTAKEAEQHLYNYFRSKGIKPRVAFGELSDDNAMDDCVMYDTIYSFNTNKLSGAVIPYWLGPVGMSSNCFWPDKAIILNTADGYKIMKEQFISSQYIVDSSSKNAVYGAAYECQQEDKKQKFKITFR
jgi:hypothetical protein